jgi:acyl-CoA thioesterase FadM
VKFSYEIFRDADDALLATGDTTHVICGRNGRPKALPPKYRNVLAELQVSNPERSEV